MNQLDYSDSDESSSPSSENINSGTWVVYSIIICTQFERIEGRMREKTNEEELVGKYEQTSNKEK